MSRVELEHRRREATGTEKPQPRLGLLTASEKITAFARGASCDKSRRNLRSAGD